MNQATQLAQRILEEVGFCVMLFRPGPKEVPKVGDVIADPIDGGAAFGKVPGPFFVAGLATADEFRQQCLKYSPWKNQEAIERDLKTCIGIFKVVAE